MEKIELQVDDVLVEVEYTYNEGDSQVAYYPDGSGYPGSPAQVDIHKVTAGGKEDIGAIISDYVFNDIEEQIYKMYED